VLNVSCKVLVCHGACCGVCWTIMYCTSASSNSSMSQLCTRLVSPPPCPLVTLVLLLLLLRVAVVPVPRRCHQHEPPQLQHPWSAVLLLLAHATPLRAAGRGRHRKGLTLVTHQLRYCSGCRRV
jgi:hypothetical protein